MEMVALLLLRCGLSSKSSIVSSAVRRRPTVRSSEKASSSAHQRGDGEGSFARAGTGTGIEAGTRSGKTVLAWENGVPGPGGAGVKVVVVPMLLLLSEVVVAIHPATR